MPTVSRVVDKLFFQYLAGAEEGRSLEICLANPDGTLSSEEPYPLAVILETDDSFMGLELTLPQGRFLISPSEMERAIAAAREGVFSERRWLEELCPKDES